MSQVVFVGLTNKINKSPLASDTLSGKVIDDIISGVGGTCIKTNLVNFAPINNSGKLRYPTKAEKDNGFSTLTNLLEKNRPNIVVCLGNIVGDYLVDKIDNVIKIKHPAYVAVYKRGDLNNYIVSTTVFINDRIPIIKNT
jgi:uracil-DNA glycosylase family 4